MARRTFLFRDASKAGNIWQVPDLWKRHVLVQNDLLARWSDDLYLDWAIALYEDGLADQSTLRIPNTDAERESLALGDVVSAAMRWHPIGGSWSSIDRGRVLARGGIIYPDPSVHSVMNHGEPAYREARDNPEGGLAIYWGDSMYALDLFVRFPEEPPLVSSGGVAGLSAHPAHHLPSEGADLDWTISFYIRRIVLVDEIIRRFRAGILDANMLHLKECSKIWKVYNSYIAGETRVDFMGYGGFREDMQNDLVLLMHECSEEV